MIKYKNIINTLIGFGLLILVWQTIIIMGKYDTALFPTPLQVWEGLLSLLYDGTLFENIRVSLIRFFLGYLSAVVTAVILGLILGRIPVLWGVIDPIAQVLRPISPIAWSPFIVLWFGIGDIPAIVAIFIAAFFPVLLSTVSGVRKVDPTYLKVSQNFGLKGFALLRKVIFPATFPYIANGLHIAVGTAWVFLVAGEMIGTQSGLGYLIVDARNSLRLDLVMTGILLIGIVGLFLDKMVGLFESWINRIWGRANS